MKELLQAVVCWMRERRVELLRREAYNGGNADRYVSARMDFWRRYER